MVKIVNHTTYYQKDEWLFELAIRSTIAHMMQLLEYRQSKFVSAALSLLDGRIQMKINLFLKYTKNGAPARLLAFWDKSDNKETLVIATHGFIKKVDKVPPNEIDRAIKLRDKYFNNNQNK